MKKSVLMALGMCSLLQATSANAVTLIKSDEARQAPSAGAITTRGIARGPGVKLVSPDPAAVNLTSPFDLKIAFEPRGGAKIDPATTKVIYLRAVPIDLLPRVKPGLSEKGIELAGAEVPPGDHQIQVTVQDTEGRVTNSVIQIHVVK